LTEINGQIHAPTAYTPRRDANVHDLRLWVDLENFYERLLAIITIPTKSDHQIFIVTDPYFTD
jgi:hypothetical protein